MQARFVGKLPDEEAGKMIEIDEEAYDETPDYLVVPNEEGGKFVDLESPNADEGGMDKFYVASVTTEDGRTIEITSADLSDDLVLVFDSGEEDNYIDDVE